MSNEQKPSDIDIALEIEEAVEDALGVAFRPHERNAVSAIIARVRREARAEAFEEAAEMCRDGLDCEWLKAEAAKERAK